MGHGFHSYVKLPEGKQRFSGWIVVSCYIPLNPVKSNEKPYLVGGWPTYPSEKWWSEWKSVGMMTFPTKWKVLKFHGSSHHQPEQCFFSKNAGLEWNGAFRSGFICSWVFPMFDHSINLNAFAFALIFPWISHLKSNTFQRDCSGIQAGQPRLIWWRRPNKLGSCRNMCIIQKNSYHLIV